MTEDHKKTLESKLWNIANTLRGKMGADEFRDYILGFIFYKYLSERMHLFADEILKHDGIKFDAIDEATADGQEMLDAIKENSVERGPTKKRVLEKVVDFVNTFIHGVAA